ncbi:alpha/beta hydrolase [Streptomyces sp. NPDC021096]|uniref:alpha/beta fold hydrolase n=1 Tax=Streptomyces sp. NPDC021096 TaxID=3154792 RepID=UPI0034063C9A
MGDLEEVRVDGVRLTYRTWGPADGPPAVLLHCLGEDGSDWAEVASWLALGGHRVYAPDLRGHGGSDWPGEYALPRMRDDVTGFLAALGLARVTLMGHSLGGAVAQLVTAAAPARVGRLVLEDVPPLVPADPPLVVPERPAGPLGFDWAVKEQLTAQRNAPDPRWWAELASFTAPTLVVAGGTTSHLPQELIAAAAERIPDCRLVTVEGAGHLVHTARPREFRAAVEEFLAATA